MEGSPATTGADGVARVGAWVLGPRGSQELTATVQGLSPLTLGATVEPGTELLVVDVGAGGGSFTLDEEGHPYDGLVVEVPSGAFPGAVEWRLRLRSDLPDLHLPAGFTRAGPALQIASTAGRAGELLTLDVPLPGLEGQPVVMVLRDPARGVMEVLPTVGRSSGSIRVMTGHLQGGLLPGEGTGLARSRFGGSATFTDEVAELLPISMVVPIEPVSTDLTRWPVVDHGSSAFPDGHGVAIPALEVVASRMGVRDLAAAVRPLSRPGFYAEAAPLAAVQLASRQLTTEIRNAVSGIQGALSGLPKQERDALVHLNVLASLSLSSGPTMVGLITEGGSEPIMATAFQGSENQLILAQAAVAGAVAAQRGPSGFNPFSVRPVADGADVEVVSVIAAQTAVVAVERLIPIMQRLAELGQTAIDSEERAQINAQLAAEAGLPSLEVEVQIEEGGEWNAAAVAEIVARTSDIALRLREMGATFHNEAGEEIASGEDGVIPLAADLDLFASSEEARAVTRFLAAQATQTAGRVRQVAAITLRLRHAPFRIDPEVIELEPDQVDVEFTATVDSPPASGYRIQWDWGDGNVTEVENSEDATHTYDMPDDYEVWATLYSGHGDRLARTSARILIGAERAWNVISFRDLDRILDDVEPGELPEAFATFPLLLDVPRRGLIIVSPDGEGRTELRLRAQRVNAWAEGIRRPPHEPWNEEVLVLGRNPAVEQNVGPFFAGWERDYWTESTTDLFSGTMDARQALGHTLHAIEDRGNQWGPMGGIRFEAVRDGNRMTGTVYIVIWWGDLDTGELYNEAPEEFRFSFEAALWGTQPR